VNKYIAYYRVSTREQGNSGLGLEAQESAVKRYCDVNHITLIRAYTEVETGKGDNLKKRPILQKALSHCKRICATLIIAKLDRLARSVYVTSLLHKSGIDFIACDIPSASRMIIQIMSAVAEEEARSISSRTKLALAALKDRGVKLGSHRPECAKNLSLIARHTGGHNSGVISKREKAEAYGEMISEVIKMRKDKMTYAGIANFLNTRGDTTRTGCDFRPSTVYTLVKLGKEFNPSFQFGV